MDSVLNQDYKNVEYIVVDPGSTDGSREIIESYGDRVVRVFEKDKGPADGLNVGFSIATGDIFYFINSDDYVMDNAFASAVAQFVSNPDIDVLLGAGVEVDAEGNKIKTYYPSSVSPEAYVNGAVTLFQQGMFFRSRAFRQISGFNSLNKTSWDGELLLNFMLKKLCFKRSMTRFAAFRIYPESITGSQRFAAQFQSDINRLYKLVYGDDAQPNRAASLWFRFRKLVCDPTYIFFRLFRS
jgi:glycosyltransferase involved in cell wall biosynthesis